MNIELYNWEELNPSNQIEIAALVSSYTNGDLYENPQMLPVSTQEIFAKHMGVVAMTGNVFTGYVSSTIPMTHEGKDMSEVGSLWVPAAHQRQGIAHKLVETISLAIYRADVIPYAFCNPSSKPVFLDSKFSDASYETIPPKAFVLCANCPKKPLNGCCDSTVIYNGVNND